MQNTVLLDYLNNPIINSPHFIGDGQAESLKLFKIC